MNRQYDVAVVGMGIVGLAHAHAAARAGQRVVVVDRDENARRASVQNFGFVTVTGQARGEIWSLARRSRDVWAAIAPAAGIDVNQTGLHVFGQREEATEVLESFLDTEMGEHCELLGPDAYASRFPTDHLAQFQSVLVSPHELRIEPRLAIPQLQDWLEERWNVDFLTQTTVFHSQSGKLETSRGTISANTIFVCPGDEISGEFQDIFAARGVTRCKLQMLRVANPRVQLPSPVMADLSLIRYEGYSCLPGAAALEKRLTSDRGNLLEAGIHLIVTQGADGTLVVGDTHEYGDAPDPFQRRDLDDRMLEALHDTLPGVPPNVLERWIGVYAWSPQQHWFSEEVKPGVHLTSISCGAGMSIAFGIAESVVGSALNAELSDAA